MTTQAHGRYFFLLRAIFFITKVKSTSHSHLTLTPTAIQVNYQPAAHRLSIVSIYYVYSKGPIPNKTATSTTSKCFDCALMASAQLQFPTAACPPDRLPIHLVTCPFGYVWQCRSYIPATWSHFWATYAVLLMMAKSLFDLI